MNTLKTHRCPACRKAMLAPVTYTREFHPHGEVLKVELFTSRCPACGAEATSAAQHDENLRRLAARKAKYGELLMGEEILALRRRYGLTQQQAAKLFGAGKIAFSRYENEVTYPENPTTKLLTLAIEKPGVMRWLSDLAGVELPLWDARMGEERGAKLQVLYRKDAIAAAGRWSREVARGRARATYGIGTLSLLRQFAVTRPIPSETANDAEFVLTEEQYA